MIVELTVREAVEEDLPRVVDLGRKFLLDGPYRDLLKDNPEKAMEFAMSVLKSVNACVLVAEDGDGIHGVFAFLMTPHYLSGEMTASELIWYVEPEARKGGDALKLLAEAERRARLHGCTKMQLSAPSEQVGDLYRFCGGYKKIEVSYQRDLCR